MAYTKYYFSRASISDNANDVKNWLTENASEYFDSVSLHTGSYETAVICNVGDTAKIYFEVNIPATSGSYESLSITLNNGLKKTIDAWNSTNYIFTYVKYAIKSDNGIMFFMDNKHSIFITKSNAGTTAVYGKWTDGTNSSYDYSKFMVADLINSEAIGTVNFKGTVISNDITSLVPICFPSGTYAPKLFITPYSQYVDYTGIIDINGTKYAYDGYAALEL